ncbi:hypothetical protein [uncultured Carboxylicivirga sp.]|uniref:tetratricopeptide repeat protein n=2 Tax=Carboxylicivirga TaxID=1628153 RepID=UPI002593D10F|nr:hypothetical protein [uncultured Carboxylicivirga sp.]
MGYMGFGLQKWIYSQKPRKAFSKDRKPIGNTIQNHETKGAFNDDTIHLIGRLKEKHTETEKRRIRILNKYSGMLKAILISFAGLILLLGAINFGLNKESQEKAQVARQKMINKRIKKEEQRAFNLVLEYGQNHLRNKEYELAIKEFEQLTINNPDNITAKEALANALYFACIEKNIECDRALKIYDELKQIAIKEQYIQNVAAIYIHNGDFEEADIELNKLKNK